MGAEFIAEEGVLKGLVLLLERGEEWTIGRDPDLCTVIIEDPKAARQQLRIVKREEGYFAENLSERQPTLLGGVPFGEPILLKHGDALTIGNSLFRFYPEPLSSGYAFSMGQELLQNEAQKEKEGETAVEEELHFSQDEMLEEVLEEPETEVEKEEAETTEEAFSEALFEPPPMSEVYIDLTPTTRFFLKVIAGPNTGAEFALETRRDYLIGTDAVRCDIVFNDLSVSREHARLSVSDGGQIAIEDLGSRNGVLVDKERVSGSRLLRANALVSLGTSTFLLIDREAPSETIATPIFEAPVEEPEELVEAVAKDVSEELSGSAPFIPPVVAAPKPKTGPILPIGTLVFALIVCGLAVLLGIGMVSLVQTREIKPVKKDYLADVQRVVRDFPAVRFTYNPLTGRLFLMGHVSTGIQHEELLYKLRGFGFIKGIDDNIVNDQAVWQEMNILLSKQPDFKGVSMHAPEPGRFVISGYLQTEKQAALLSDYLNINFNYLNLLENRILVEESVKEEVASQLIQQGFGGVNLSLSNGELQFTGYLNSTQIFAFEKLLDEFRKIPGIRTVRSFVVTVTPEQGVVDLNRKYPGRYKVTGYSKQGDVNINVVINGKILTRGSTIDGYTVTGIQPGLIFLEKDELKYKIEYKK